MVAKGKKRLEFSGQLPEKNQFKKGVGKALILLFLSIIMAAFGFYFLLPNLNWGTRIWEFLSYSDMGIPQGIVLLPLMILNGIMLYKQHYIMPAKYRTTIIKHIIQPLVNQGLILLIASAVFLGSTFIINYPQEIIIAIMVLGISSYRWIMRVTPI